MWAVPIRQVGNAGWFRRLCLGRPRFTSGGATPAEKKPLEKVPSTAETNGNAASNAKAAKPKKSRIAPIAISAVLGSGAAFYAWQKYQQQAEQAKPKPLPKVTQTPFVPKKSSKRVESKPDPIPVSKELNLQDATETTVEDVAIQKKIDEVVNTPQEDMMLDMTTEIMSTMAATAAAGTSGDTLANMAQSVASGTEKRNMVRNGLNQAFAAQDVGKIAEVLATARACFIGTGAKMQPSEAAQDDVSAAVVHEFNKEEAMIAEKTDSANLGLEKVKKRIIELTGYLATIRYTHLEAAEMAMSQESEGTVDHAGNVRDMATERELHELQIRLQQELEGAVTKLLQEEEWLQSEREYALTKERCARLSEVVSFNSGLSALEEALNPAAATVQNVHSYNNLSNAVSGFHHAILSGGNAHIELEQLQSAATKTDPFINQLLVQLPTGCAELCQGKGGVPTEPLICSRLGAQVKDLTAAAFVPPGSGLFGEIVGRVFSWLYILDPAAVPLESVNSKSKGATEVANNLIALGSVSEHLHGGKVNAIYASLENSLTGTCRERAAGWLSETRNTLLLLQTLWAIQARVQCLNAAVPDAIAE